MRCTPAHLGQFGQQVLVLPRQTQSNQTRPGLGQIIQAELTMLEAAGRVSVIIDFDRILSFPNQSRAAGGAWSAFSATEISLPRPPSSAEG